MHVVPEDLIPSLVSPKAALAAIEAVFVATFKGDARNFPVVREALGHKDALYGFKSGANLPAGLLGVKAGGYWPHNSRDQGLGNHQSSILLFDPDTGRMKAVVGGNYLTAVRTAAASAVSIAWLSRKDSRCLGILGAGKQSEHQIRAALGVRDFTKVLIWNRTVQGAEDLAARLTDLPVDVEVASLDAVVRRADVLITITSSFAPLVEADWVRPGTHLACMGTDTRGKQEVHADLVARSSVFTDEIDQALTIGEAQHAHAQGALARGAVAPLGRVIAGQGGRRREDEITLYDGTGVGLQDLAVADLALRAALDQGLGLEVPL